ncbi:hypothetical protein [Nocardia lasii]|uniref:DUF4352 domain-containing protein n=1 Tax=Nocardia lasii TaxID=1616107 RepID=A0ABW1JNW8_9NOCA
MSTPTQPQPWTTVADGTWTQSGGIAIGQPVLSRYSDYAITVVDRPVLTTEDDGKTVTMFSLIKVERRRELGQYTSAGEALEKSDHFIFIPGNRSYPRHDEVYGLDVAVECGDLPRLVGEAADCAISFSAPADEIQNSYWEINGSDAAAWPSQS